MPYFTTTGSKEFSSTLMIQLKCPENAMAQILKIFESRESHSSKKKAEDDVAEVALAALNDLYKLNVEGTTAIKPSTKADSSLDDLFESIAKAVNLLNTNDFLTEESMPAECLLLFGGVQSALNRINPIHRKDSKRSFSCLLEALESPLQKIVAIERDGEKYLLRSNLATSSPNSEKKPTSTGSHLKRTDVGRFVVIPSAEDEIPYEVQFSLSSASSSTEHNGGDGIRMMEAFAAMYTALKTSSNFSISTPLFIPTGENYKNNLSKLFNGANLKESNRTEDSKDISSSQIVKPRLLIKHNQNRGTITSCKAMSFFMSHGLLFTVVDVNELIIYFTSCIYVN